jgi:hypothetical protein
MIVPVRGGIDAIRRVGLFSGANFVLRSLGLVLLIAAALKGYELAIKPTADTSLLRYRWLAAALVEFELFLGLWLLSGVYQGHARVVALVAFAVFLCANLYQALSGEESCGCFGAVRISPWLTLIFDFLACAALWAFRPLSVSGTSAASPRWRLLTTVAASIAVGVPVGMVILTSAPAMLSPSGDVVGDAETVLLEPMSWVGRRFPLLGHIDVGSELAHGDWIVMLYDWRCAVCQQILPQYVELAHALASQSQSLRVALVELSPSSESHAPPGDRVCTRGRMDNSHRWLVATPVFVRLRSGVPDVVTRTPDALLYGATAMADNAGATSWIRLIVDQQRIQRRSQTSLRAAAGCFCARSLVARWPCSLCYGS